MDSNTIKEIANQLGIATDAVTKEVIPAYAQFEIGWNICAIIVLAILFIIALILTIFFVKRAIADDYSEYYPIWGLIAGISTIALLILLIVAIVSIVLWIHCPYGSFVNMILAH